MQYSTFDLDHDIVAREAFDLDFNVELLFANVQLFLLKLPWYCTFEVGQQAPSHDYCVAAYTEVLRATAGYDACRLMIGGYGSW